MLAARVASAAALAAQPQLTPAQRKVRADAAAAEAASIDADAALICEHASIKVRCACAARLLCSRLGLVCVRHALFER